MDEKRLRNIRERADAKLRYAKIYLNELMTFGIIGGSDIDRAHQESFLYHLLGAKEAFIIELNYYYQANLPTNNITVGKLRNTLKKTGITCPELVELYLLEDDEVSWLSQAKVMRDYSTHISNVPRAYHLNGEYHQKVFLKNPRTDIEIKQHFVDMFVNWFTFMTDLLDRLRSTALKVLSPLTK